MNTPPLPHAPALGAILESSLYVDDLDAAAQFYGSVLGLTELVRVPGRHIFYRVGASVLLLFNPAATVKPPGNPRLPVPPHGAHGPGHLCFAATHAQITVWRARLIASGHQIEADFAWPNGARSLYFRDPAGNSIEIAEQKLWGQACPIQLDCKNSPATPRQRLLEQRVRGGG